MNAQWGIHVPIISGELFSSWLVRVALAHGCDPLVLTGSIWPDWRAWMTDLDRGLNESRISILSAFSGLSVQEIETTMLRSSARIISCDKYGVNVVWPWILALGSRNRVRKGGLQYCPSCLAEGLIPFFNKEWRYAWHTVCVTHQCLLSDRCPRCGSPVEIHRLTAEDKTISICATCKYDLRTLDLTNQCVIGLQFQNKADSVLYSNHGFYGHIVLSASDWFTLARFFLNLIRRAASCKENKVRELLKCLGVNLNTLVAPATGLPLEYLPVNERAILFEATNIVLSTNPTVLINLSKELSVSVQTLKEKRNVLPDAINVLLGELPEKRISQKNKGKEIPNKPRSKQAVMRMWARMERNFPKD